MILLDKQLSPFDSDEVDRQLSSTSPINIDEVNSSHSLDLTSYSSQQEPTNSEEAHPHPFSLEAEHHSESDPLGHPLESSGETAGSLVEEQ
jgi:hypothetical protein